MMPVRNLRNRLVHPEKSKKNDEVPFNSIVDTKKTKPLDVPDLKHCKKKPVVESKNENNNALRKSGKENIDKRNLRNKSEKVSKNKLSVLKENNTNLQNIPVTAVGTRLKEKTITENQKSIEAKENAKVSFKSDSSKFSGNKKKCNLLQTKLLVLKENSSNIECERTPAVVRKTRNNCKVKNEAKSKTQNKPNCYMPIENYFKKLSKENSSVLKNTETEAQVNASKKFPIWKKIDISKTDHTKKKQRRSTQDVYDIALDEDLLASSKKSKNTKTRVNHIKKRVKQNNKKRLNYPKSNIKTKCTPVKVKEILGMETQTTTTPEFFDEITVSKEKQNNLSKNGNNDSILNEFHDENECPNIVEQLPNSIEIADVHHAENEIEIFPAAPFEMDNANGISEQILNVNNIENNTDVHNTSENLNLPTISFEINDPIEISKDSSVDMQQSKCIDNRKNVTELADELEKSFQVVLTSTPDRSHKQKITQKSGIFNAADLSSITILNKSCLNAFVSTPSDSSSNNIAASTVTNVEINNENNNIENLFNVEPPKKKSKKNTAEFTLFESPTKNDEKRKKKQKPISFYLFQDVVDPPAELEESVLKPKKTYKEADNFKVHVMKTKRNAAMAKQVAKKSKVDLLIDSLIKHFDEVGETELCIE